MQTAFIFGNGDGIDVKTVKSVGDECRSQQCEAVVRQQDGLDLLVACFQLRPAREEKGSRLLKSGNLHGLNVIEGSVLLYY